MGGGFWETFSQNAGGAFDDLNRNKEEKRRRALQKLKFITENADVGSPVDQQTASEIQDYASEGAPMIENGAFTGTPDQQRQAEFREWAGSNPTVDEDQFMTKGLTAGTISPAAYSSFQGRKIAAEQSRQNALDRAVNQKTLQDDRQANQADVIRLAASLRQGRGGGGGVDQGENEFYGTKADIQKLVANRKQYGNDPYSHLINNVFGNPQIAAKTLGSGNEPADINSAEPWDNYVNTLEGDPEIRSGFMNDYGLRVQELNALQKHLRRIANQRRGR